MRFERSFSAHCSERGPLPGQSPSSIRIKCRNAALFPSPRLLSVSAPFKGKPIHLRVKGSLSEPWPRFDPGKGRSFGIAISWLKARAKSPPIWKCRLARRCYHKRTKNAAQHKELRFTLQHRNSPILWFSLSRRASNRCVQARGNTACKSVGAQQGAPSVNGTWPAGAVSLGSLHSKTKIYVSSATWSTAKLLAPEAHHGTHGPSLRAAQIDTCIGWTVDHLEKPRGSSARSQRCAARTQVSRERLVFQTQAISDRSVRRMSKPAGWFTREREERG